MIRSLTVAILISVAHSSISGRNSVSRFRVRLFTTPGVRTLSTRIIPVKIRIVTSLLVHPSMKTRSIAIEHRTAKIFVTVMTPMSVNCVMRLASQKSSTTVVSACSVTIPVDSYFVLSVRVVQTASDVRISGIRSITSSMNRMTRKRTRENDTNYSLLCQTR
jgi:hypothetical protein